MILKSLSQTFLVLIFLTHHYVDAGKGDTLEDLKVGYSNLDFTHSYVQVPVEVTHGEVPKGLEGTFVRHGCGAFGNVVENETSDPLILDRIDHLFDCIEIDQSFHFHDGKAYFSSRFYDININDIFRDKYQQDMKKSSVFTGTIFSRMNDTAIDINNNDMHKPGKMSRVWISRFMLLPLLQ